MTAIRRGFDAARIGLLCAVLLGSAGCAADAIKAPHAPDESVLAPAQKALAKAREANAMDFAPRSVAAARRRIVAARDMLYSAARAERPLTEREHQRIEQLVDAARLDARSALVQTQAGAVETKLGELRDMAASSAARRGNSLPQAGGAS